jgi:tRNA-2-methylthio-N6-dimethylallyladenosine synthase
MVGRSPYLNAVHLAAPAQSAGTIITARIVGTEANSLAGERIAA